MAISGGDWEALVRPRFDFLAYHGFAFERVDASSVWETSAIYLSAKHAVLVTDSREYTRAQVTLIRLVAGHIPAPSIWFDRHSELDRTLLDNVVEARSPELLADLRSVAGRSETEVVAMLDLCATLLVEVTPDLLDGSDQPFTDAARVIEARVDRNPQQVTVWLAADASAEAEDEAFGKARLSAP